MQQIAVEMRLMGKIDISVNGAEVVWKTKRIGKLWSILCLLAVSGEDWVSSREMARLLWGEKDSAKSRNDVKSAISHLRRELAAGTAATGDEVIEYGNGGYRLGPAIRLSADFVDIGEAFRKLETRNNGLDRRLNLCRRLAELYKGDFYHDEGCPGWMEEHARGMAAAFTPHMENCAGLLLEAGRYEDVLALYGKLGAWHPPCDSLKVCYYRALRALNRHDAILQEFDAMQEDFERRGKGESPACAEIKRIARLALQENAQSTRLLEDVKSDLAPKNKRSARVLDYRQLKDVCRQNPGRYAMTIFTLQPTPGAQQGGEAVQQAMDHLMAVAVGCLRGHDIITPYSDNQMLIVMPNHSLDSSHLVRERLNARLAQRLDFQSVSVSTDVAAI